MKTHITATSIRRGILAGAFLAVATASHAAIVIQFDQVGANVVETGSGSANLAALTFAGNSLTGSGITPNVGDIALGAGVVSVDKYTGISGPSNFGTGGGIIASSGTGSEFGLRGSGAAFLKVPAGYVSGTALSGSNTFSGQTFASLGILAGTYAWTWGTGATADSLTVQVGPAAAAVPEPGSALAGMLALGVCLSGLAGRSRRQSAAV